MKDQKGFTFVELLIVIGIIGILLAVAVQSIAKNYYVENGRWPDDYKGPKGQFERKGKWYALGQGVVLGEPANSSQPDSRKSAKELRELTNNEVSYFYDKQTHLCFAKVWATGDTSAISVVVVPCSNLGIK